MVLLFVALQPFENICHMDWLTFASMNVYTDPFRLKHI